MNKQPDKKVYANSEFCTGCELCTFACSVTRFGEANPKKSGIFIKRDLFERYEIQFICRHCEIPFCVDACIVGTMQKDKSTGFVNNDPKRCVGCWSCIMVCPYDSIMRSFLMEERKEIAVKCNGCPEREIPACVQVCPTGALAYE